MAKANQSAAAAKAATAPTADKADVNTGDTADQTEKLDPKTAITILKSFSASENGCTVDDYAPGLCAGLPPVASKFAIAIEAVSEEDAAKLLKALEAEPKQETAE
ncbi:MAG: hypothetical protein CML20_10265 [Rheinheimera sp.]|uniref:hypothetical protein n=1 Tax=Arsukibacterium sp. UBA3155 TaxID=1946058 RepID=UPI000C92CE83|nr:hypothetical protein [Arsukibacterium sp. UBA3155]MAD75157.1 hypothetical protein [Rheinheimera sp.]|tara:strand:- start:35103 stop:35417 length:315 start_codon:yes stop_codon:yes gene_type:complete